MRVNIFLLPLFLLSVLSFAQEEQVIHVDSVPKYSFSTIPDFWNQMDDIFDDPNFSNAHWGVVIQSLENGEYFYKRNENKFFIPASNMKLFTSAAGLVKLGADYKFSTNIYTEGEIDGSTLNGNLVIQGRGDPTISGRFFDNNIHKIFNDWADSLLEKGIDEISGNIIGDDDLFDDTGLGTGWAWDYESYWYAAPSGAISFNDNCVDIFVSVDANTNLAKVTTSPNTKYVIVLNKVLVVGDDSTTSIKIYRERGTNVISVYGTVKPGDNVKTYCTINNPTQYFVVVLKDVLEKKGIKVTGYPVDVDDIPEPLDYGRMRLLFTHYSQPLKDIIKVINKNSQNFFAEQLLKTIGLEIEGYGTIENGVKASNAVFEDMGMNTDNLILVDGSGLSRLNLVTPRKIVSLLNYMYKSNFYIPFYNSLPIAGMDGTLGNRMKNTKAQNNVRAKTGYLGAVRSLSGYVFTGDNEPVAFSIIANNFNVPLKLAENIQDLVCLRLANFKRK